MQTLNAFAFAIAYNDGLLSPAVYIYIHFQSNGKSSVQTLSRNRKVLRTDYVFTVF